MEGEGRLPSYLSKLDPTLMAPKRFVIMSILYVIKSATFSELLKATRLTPGDLDSNLRRLRREGYIRFRRVLTLRGPRVKVEITEEGVRKYEELTGYLTDLLKKVKSPRAGVDQ